MKTRTKICIVGPDLSRRGGVSNHVRTLLNSPLAEIFNLKYFRVGPAYHDSKFRKIFKALITPIRFLGILWLYRPKLVHLNPSFDPKSIYRELSMLILCRFHRRPGIVQFHGGTIQSLLKNEKLPFLVKIFLKLSSFIIVLTEKQKKPLLNFVAENKIAIAPNMVNAGKFYYQLEENGHYKKILFMSRIDRSKGVYDFLQAIPEVLKKAPDTKFIYAGDGPDIGNLQTLCKINGLNNHVEFLGYIENEQKIEVLNNADIFVFPTHLNEGMPYALLEAMASGLPIIATTEGAIAELIRNNENGILIPSKQPELLAQSIIKLIEDSELRKMYGQNNRESALHIFDINIVSLKFKKLYDEQLFKK